MGFMAGQLAGGRSFRAVNVLDHCVTGFCVANADNGLQQGRFGYRGGLFAAIRTCRTDTEPDDRMARQAGPIRVDNSPDYVSATLQTWAERRSTVIRYIQPGKPQQNAYVERYNRTVRTENARMIPLQQHRGGPGSRDTLALDIQQ